MGQYESALVDDLVAPHCLSARTLAGVAEYINEGPSRKRIVILTGAGISTAVGISDFRSPKTGLYHKIARLNLPYAEAVFDIGYFRRCPEPFYCLARELYPGNFQPTISHAFLALLARKRLLQMLFTQNIDCLERAAGVPADKIVEAHGSFASQRCIDCKTAFPDAEMRQNVAQAKVPRCMEAGCDGIVKPDIFFFGEPLPSTFSENAHQTSMADLVLVMGTSLTVYPFAGLPAMARDGTPRLLVNLEHVAQIGGRPDDVMSSASATAASADSPMRSAGATSWSSCGAPPWARTRPGDSYGGRKIPVMRPRTSSRTLSTTSRRRSTSTMPSIARKRSRKRRALTTTTTMRRSCVTASLRPRCLWVRARQRLTTFGLNSSPNKPQRLTSPPNTSARGCSPHRRAHASRNPCLGSNTLGQIWLKDCVLIAAPPMTTTTIMVRSCGRGEGSLRGSSIVYSCLLIPSTRRPTPV